MSYWDSVKHFKPSEFDSPDAPGSGATGMQEQFVRQLDAMRDRLAFPLVVTSGYRTPAHNVSVGGARDSDHTRGFCADVSVMSKIERAKINQAAVAVGMRQIAFGDRIVHLGSDPDRAEMVGIYHPGEPGRWY